MQNLNYIKGFHAIRAISVILVVLTHMDISDAMLTQTDFMERRVFPMFSGEFGVRMFFCLSGFLITRILLNEWKIRGRIGLRNFFVRRAIRLVPPLIIF
ncbi:MAG TPA: acyltransferase family protein, partial [Taishania sp.]|nr:acyltransferase family protein [Taishania sp.]